MIVFNDLRISEDETYILVDCSVEDKEEYENIYIKSIYLDYYKNVVTFGVPSESTSIRIDDISADDHTVKAKRIRIPKSEILASHMGITDIAGGLFHVIVTCDGTLPASMSQSDCGEDSMVHVGIILDWKMLYDRGMRLVNKYIASKALPCSDNNPLNDFTMMWHGLVATLAAKDYKQLGRMWDLFMRTYSRVSTISSINGCGCQ